MGSEPTRAENPQVSYSLLPHQLECVERTLREKTLLNTSEPGTGKTLTVIELHRRLRVPTVIIAPAFLLPNWKAEFLKFKVDDLMVDYFTHHQVRKGGLQKRYQLLCIDESHLGFSNTQSKVFKALMNYLTKIHLPEYRVLLSGTPIRNAPSELFGQLVILGYREYRNVYTFRERYSQLVPAFFGSSAMREVGIKDQKGFKKLLDSWTFGVRLRDVIHLPELYSSTFRVEIPTHLDELLSEYMTLDDLERALSSDKGIQAKRATAIAKARALLEAKELLETLVKPVLVFSDHPDAQRLLMEGLGCKGIVSELNGTQRQQLAQEFQDGVVDTLVVSIACGGVGLNLYRARTVVFSDLSWVPANNHQALARAYRHGNESCHVIYVIGGNHDNHLTQILTRKQQIVDSL